MPSARWQRPRRQQRRRSLADAQHPGGASHVLRRRVRPRRRRRDRRPRRPLPRRPQRRELWENLVEGARRSPPSPRDELEPGTARGDGGAREAGLRAGARHPRGRRDCSTRRSSASLRAEAEVLDPQQRVFLEAAWEALENAGYGPRRSPAPIGVFAGHEQQLLLPAATSVAPDVTDASARCTTMMGNEKDYLATRVSYKLDLRGPALNVQTACSTSLVAVCTGRAEPAQLPVRHGARRRRLDHAAPEARLPLPGGRDHLAGRPLPGVRRRAPRAPCSATASASWCLKRLDDALADGDTIYAVIKGVGDQQRRRVEGQLHRAERRRAGRGDRDGAGSRRHRPGHDLLRRGARHRHAARRSDRDRRPHPGVPRRGTAETRLLRDRLGQDATSATSTRRPASPA